MKLSLKIIVLFSFAIFSCLKHGGNSNPKIASANLDQPSDLNQENNDFADHPANKAVLETRFARAIALPEQAQSYFNKVSSHSQGQELNFATKIELTPLADIGLEGGIDTTFSVTYSRDIEVQFMSSQLEQKFDSEQQILLNAPFEGRDANGRLYNHHVFQCAVTTKNLNLDAVSSHSATSFSIPFLDKILKGLKIKTTKTNRDFEKSISSWSNRKVSPYMNVIPKDHQEDTFHADPKLYFNLCLEWAAYRSSANGQTIQDLANESIKKHTVASYQRALLDESDGFSCSPELKQQSACELDHPDVKSWREQYEVFLIEQEKRNYEVVAAVGSVNGLSASHAKALCMSYKDLKLAKNPQDKTTITPSDSQVGVCRLRSSAYHPCPAFDAQGKRQLNMARFLRAQTIDKNAKDANGKSVYPNNFDFQTMVLSVQGHILEEQQTNITYWYQTLGAANLELHCEPNHQCLQHSFERIGETYYAAVCVPDNKAAGFSNHWNWATRH